MFKGGWFIQTIWRVEPHDLVWTAIDDLQILETDKMMWSKVCLVDVLSKGFHVSDFEAEGSTCSCSGMCMVGLGKGRQHFGHLQIIVLDTQE